MNHPLVSAMVCFVFSATTSGTLAHAENAYQRARRGARLQERTATTEIKAAQAIKSVLDRWNQVGSKVEDLTNDEVKLGRAITSHFGQTRKEINEMTAGQLRELKEQLKKVQRQATHDGDVATAENLEATLELASRDFREKVTRAIESADYDQLKKTILLEVEQAGTVKAYLEGSMQKLTTRFSKAATIVLASIFTVIGIITLFAGALLLYPISFFVAAIFNWVIVSQMPDDHFKQFWE